MAVHRERVDPIATPDGSLLVHRRWLLPDDQARPVELQRLARLWRGLREESFLHPDKEAWLERLALPDAVGAEAEELDLPLAASPGALLAAAGQALLLTQMVWVDADDRRDPYAEPEEGVRGYRDYTLYAIAHERFRLLPVVPRSIACAACGFADETALPRFGEGRLLDLEATCPGCRCRRDPGRDTVLLRTGARFLLEETIARAALSIELPAAPEAEELPDAKAAALVREAFGDFDELADDRVAAAE